MNIKVAFAALSIVCFAASAHLVGAEKVASPKKPELKIDPTSIENNRPGMVATYADVVEPVQKAVVSVYSTKLVKQRQQINPLFRQFFGDQVPPQERESREQGLGSGVIVSPNGYILTNNHVVEGADELNVTLPDDREFKAKVIGTDPQTDIAVIKIEAENLPVTTLSDSDKLRVGDVVFAIGNPLGIGQTVTMGIVSALGRNNLGLLTTENEAGYENFIQTDAAINMGNSGGALIDAKGRLVGINTAIVSTTRGNIGIGFAIPVNLAALVMHSLIETGTVSRGFLGINVNPLTADLAEAMGLKKDARGVVITDVSAESPADRAGLKRGDAILSIDGRALSSLQDLRLLISQTAPGTEVTLKTMRVSPRTRDRKDQQPKEMTVVVKLGKRAGEAGRSNEILEGVIMSPVDDASRRRLNLDPRVGGLLVTDVAQTSPFIDRLVTNVVIVEINRMAVPDLAAARAAVAPGENNLLLVYYRGEYRYVVVAVK